MGPVGDNVRGTAKRVALVASAAVILLVGGGTLYVFIYADEAKAVQTTADASRFCKRALSASTEVTCAAMVAEHPSDPWGREYLCERLDANQLRITSLGRDGRPGGQAADADVVCEPRTTGDKNGCACRIGSD